MSNQVKIVAPSHSGESKTEDATAKDKLGLGNRIWMSSKIDFFTVVQQ